MRGLLRSEIFRARKRTLTWILVAIVVALDLLLYAAMTIYHVGWGGSRDNSESLRLASIHDNGLALVSFIGSIVIVVFASSLIGSEYGWNTLRPILARARSRASFLTAKWLTVLVSVAVLSVVGVLATIFAATVASLLTGEGFEWAFATPVDAVAISARFVVGFLPTAALAMFVALLLRSNAAGIGIGIAFGFVEPVVFALLRGLSDVVETVEHAGIGWNANRIFTLGGDNDVSTGDAWVSAGILALWVALFVAVSYRVFARRDVTSG